MECHSNKCKSFKMYKVNDGKCILMWCTFAFRISRMYCRQTVPCTVPFGALGSQWRLFQAGADQASGNFCWRCDMSSCRYYFLCLQDLFWLKHLDHPLIEFASIFHWVTFANWAWRKSGTLIADTYIDAYYHFPHTDRQTYSMAGRRK